MKQNKLKLNGATISGPGMTHAINTSIITGPEDNGYAKGELMDANAVKQTVDNLGETDMRYDAHSYIVRAYGFTPVFDSALEYGEVLFDSIKNPSIDRCPKSDDERFAFCLGDVVYFDFESRYGDKYRYHGVAVEDCEYRGDYIWNKFVIIDLDTSTISLCHVSFNVKDNEMFFSNASMIGFKTLNLPSSKIEERFDEKINTLIQRIEVLENNA